MAKRNVIKFPSASDDWRDRLVAFTDLSIADKCSSSPYDLEAVLNGVINDARLALGVEQSNTTTFGVGDYRTAAGALRGVVDQSGLDRNDPSTAETLMLVIQRRLDEVLASPPLLDEICENFRDLLDRYGESHEDEGPDPCLLDVFNAVQALVDMHGVAANSTARAFRLIIGDVLAAIRDVPPRDNEGARLFREVIDKHGIDRTAPKSQCHLVAMVEKSVEIKRPALVPRQCCFACGNPLAAEHEMVPSPNLWNATYLTLRPMANEHYCNKRCRSKGDRRKPQA